MTRRDSGVTANRWNFDLSQLKGPAISVERAGLFVRKKNNQRLLRVGVILLRGRRRGRGRIRW